VIELLARPGRIVVGEESSLAIRVTNPGPGPCRNVRVDLEVPGALGLCSGARAMRLRVLRADATHDEPLVVLAQEAGTHLIGVPNLSFLDELGNPHRARGVTIPVVAEVRPKAEAPTSSWGSIFISYRRMDTGPVARSLADDLRRAFPRRVFYDHTSLRPGDLFYDRLDRELAACEVVLALIGPRWLSSMEERRRRGAEDLLRHEIVTALHRDVLLIPVLVGDASVPERGDLPEDVAGLFGRQTVRLHADTESGRAEVVAAIREVWRGR
jgi:hypothetical protein